MSSHAADQAELRVALVQDEGDGALFFRDVCSMLEHLAARAACELTVVSKADESGLSVRTYRYRGALPPLLDREVGGHRGQFVPAGSVGRVVTSRVEVDAPSATTRARDTAVIKTYQYFQSCVTRHETGARLSLGDVLAGREPAS